MLCIKHFGLSGLGLVSGRWHIQNRVGELGGGGICGRGRRRRGMTVPEDALLVACLFTDSTRPPIPYNVERGVNR
jgi:hypothetical protein